MIPFLLAFFCLWDALALAAMARRTPDNDFAKAYYSTAAFLHGGEMYGINPSTVSGYWGGKPLYLWNLNPPHFHVILLPLAALPIYPALALWCLINIACFAASLHWIGHELQLTPRQRGIALVGVLAFAGTTSALLSGHCSFLLLALVTRMWLAARHGRWTRAGAYLGVGMAVKPFLLMLLPYLVLRRRWKAAGAAVGTALLSFALGVAVFGTENHRAWYAKLGDSTWWTWQFVNGSLHGLLSRTLTANPMGASLADVSPLLVSVLWLCIGVPIGLATLAVAPVETTPAGVDRAFAILLVASLLLCPLGWVYYFCLPMGPVAAVALAWWKAESSAWSRGLLVAGLCGLLCPLPVPRLFQPNPLATVLLGNLYSYSIVAIWTALLIDRLRLHCLWARGLALQESLERGQSCYPI